MSGPNTIPMGDIPLGFSATASDRSAQVIQIDNGKTIIAVWFAALISAIAVIGFMWVEHRVSIAEKEARLVEYYLMDASSRTPEEMKAWAKFREEHK